VLAITLPGGNHVALWTYAILFFARISAKLNLFFGVPRINLEFIPKPLNHLKSHFRQGPISAFFPVAITGLSFAVACFAERVVSTSDPVAETGFILLTALSALALLEHWLMVLPLPDARLWRWMLPGQPAQKTPKTGPSHGL
jgi:putative photosynthetic complex assembly protein 2